MMAGRNALLVCLLVASCIVSLPSTPADEAPDKPLAVGTAAPDFTIATLEGNQVSLSAWRGHVVVVNYFITWYRDAARHLSVIEHLATRYSPQGLRVISISLDEGEGGPDATRTFVTTHEIAHPVAADPHQVVAARYGVRALPAIFVIGPEGKIVAYHEGYMEGDDKKIEGMISQALAASGEGETADESADTGATEDQEPVCHCFKQKDE